MQLSELIQQLQDIHNKHGDLPVQPYVFQNNGCIMWSDENIQLSVVNTVSPKYKELQLLIGK